MQVGSIGRLYSLLKSPRDPSQCCSSAQALPFVLAFLGPQGWSKWPLVGLTHITEDPKKIRDSREVTGCHGWSSNRGSFRTQRL